MSEKIKKPSSLARLAVDTIKEAKQAGEEIGRMITDIQADNEKQIRQYQYHVLTERRNKRAHERELDQLALNEWLSEEERKKNLNEIKREVEKTYGKGAWEKIQSTKEKMKRIEEEDIKVANEMRRKMDDLFWWCLGIAALITYAFKLYK